MQSIFRFLAFLSLPFLLISGCRQSGKSLRAGLDPLPRVVTMENHTESYRVWEKANVRNRVVVHIDTHIDLNWMPEKDYRAVNSAKSSSDFQNCSIQPGQFYEPGKRVLHVGNWLYPALRSGMAASLYWVVPDSAVHSARWLRDLKTGMRLHFTNVNPREIESFHIRDSVITGRLFGIPVTILPLNRLPIFNEPVLLDIDLDYFQFDSALLLNRLPTPQKSIRRFVKVLRKKKVASDLVTVCYSVEQGYLDFKNRDLGDSLRNALTMVERDSSAIVLKNSVTSEPSANQLTLFQADARFYDQNYEEASRLYRDVIQRNPKSIKPYLNLAECDLNLGKPKDALQALKSIEPKAAGFPQFWKIMGDSHVASLNNSKAVRDYRKALALNPENGRLWEKLGLMFKRLNQFRKAETAFLNGIRFRPYAIDIQLQLYLLYKQLRFREKARNCLIQILETDPADFEAWAELGRMYQANHQPESAQKAFRRALQIRPSEPSVLTALGRILLRQKSYAAAQQLFLQALESDPDNPALKGNLGVVLLRTKQFSAAENIFQQILTIDPRNALAWYNLAMALTLQGKKHEAKKSIQKAVLFGGEKFRKLARRNPLFQR